MVAFGERDGVRIGHALLAVNGQPLTYKGPRSHIYSLFDRQRYAIKLQFMNTFIGELPPWTSAVHGCNFPVGQELPDGRDVFDVLAEKTNFPLNLKFGRPKITTNEVIQFW